MGIHRAQSMPNHYPISKFERVWRQLAFPWARSFGLLRDNCVPKAADAVLIPWAQPFQQLLALVQANLASITLNGAPEIIQAISVLCFV